MERPNLRMAFGAQVPRCEVCKFITLTEGKYHRERFDLNVSMESGGDDREEMKKLMSMGVDPY